MDNTCDPDECKEEPALKKKISTLSQDNNREKELYRLFPEIIGKSPAIMKILIDVTKIAIQKAKKILIKSCLKQLIILKKAQ